MFGLQTKLGRFDGSGIYGAFSRLKKTSKSAVTGMEDAWTQGLFKIQAKLGKIDGSGVYGITNAFKGKFISATTAAGDYWDRSMAQMKICQ